MYSTMFCKLRTSSPRETRAAEKRPGASTLNEENVYSFLSLFLLSFSLTDPVDSCDTRVDCTRARARFFFFRANHVLSHPALLSFLLLTRFSRFSLPPGDFFDGSGACAHATKAGPTAQAAPLSKLKTPVGFG